MRTIRSALQPGEGRVPIATREVSPERVLERAIGVLFFVSGIPALVNQVAWQRILALHSGVGAFSVAVIVAAYMAGLGLGSLAGGSLSRWVSRRNALRLFAATELAIGLFAAFSPYLYYEMPMIPASWFQGTSWRVGLVHLLVLLPPTCLMGMTFPLLVRALVREVPEAARLIGRLYGLNIVGAAVGALVTPWLLIPSLGLEGAIRFGVACNVATGVGALLLGRGLDVAVAESMLIEADGPASSVNRRPIGFWLVLYALSGFLAVALEVIWFRLIDVGVKATAYTFGTVLAVYLLGLAIGTLLGARMSRRWVDPLAVFLACQCALLVVAGLVLILITRQSPDAFGLAEWFNYWAGYEPMSPRQSGWWATLGLYGVFPIVLHGAPTVLMGLSFGALQKGVQDEARTSGFKVGLLQAANIAGCVAGSLAVGLWWFGGPGTASTLRGLVGAGVGVALLGMAATSRRLLFLGFGIALAVITANMPSGDELWRRLHGIRDNVEAFIAEDLGGVAALQPEGGRWRMSTNGKGQSHLPFGGIHSKLGALPATLRAAPESVAIIGLGSGDTAWASACRRQTRTVTVFETCSGQRGLLERLAAAENLESLRAFLADPRVTVIEADGRHALATQETLYDLIEADAIRPNGAYSGNLYSVEFFELCRGRLKPGGLMCTWAPTPRTTATFRRVFPHVYQLDGGVILIGTNEPLTIDVDAWRGRLADPEVSRYLGPEALNECLAALPSARELPAPGVTSPDWINTDLFPRDEYESPLQLP